MKKIAVVITTYNSAKYIGRLIDKLLSQSYLARRIIIVDNNSSDNTCSIINGYHNDKIHLHQLGANLGGAGGFATGFEIAKNSDCDYIVSLDDDAYPASDTFIADMVQITEQHDYDVISALVVDSDNHELAAYEYQVNGVKHTKIGDIQKVSLLDNDIKLFNGVLFDKKVVEKVGIPRAEFFIRGDEQEYKMRILHAGFKTAIFTQATIYHPTSVNEYFYIKGKRYHHLDSPFKLFYSTRNQAYMLRLRDDIDFLKMSKIVYKQFWRYTWFYLVYKKDVRSYCLWLKAFIYGFVGYMNNDFKG
ncbi:glycosyltransferase [Moraxella sp. FZLJ2107]|uniref:glycosyltransferase n=1 Tax=unclassified Moraxella TaxID=2685852 RepID=UPI0020C8ACB3|nr:MULTISPECIES: glycosyltransferase [unclassified Moraxella]UTO04339.1 glycosyltransferase [Moraxella sp. FZLJ2107]UTO23172.1 glycosyltransferase [Moraxella sp. FZLJ2109]